MSCNLVNIWLTIACKIAGNHVIIATSAKKPDRKKLYFEALVGIASAAVAAGSFCWMAKYTVLKEADMIVIAAFLWLWVACKLLTWANRRNTHVA